MSEQVNNVSYPNSEIVQINDRIITVKKLGLIKYAQLSESMQSLISSIVKIINYRNDEDESMDVGSIIATLIQENVNQVIKFLDIAIPELGYEYICNEVGLTDLFVLIEAILRVNNINKVIADVKKLISGLQMD